MIYDLEIENPKKILSFLYIDHNPMSPIEVILSEKNPKLIGLKHSDYNHIVDYINKLGEQPYFKKDMTELYEELKEDLFNFSVTGPSKTELILGSCNKQDDIIKMNPAQFINSNCHEEKIALS